GEFSASLDLFAEGADGGRHHCGYPGDAQVWWARHDGGEHPAGGGLGNVLVVRRVEADEASISAYFAEALRRDAPAVHERCDRPRAMNRRAFSLGSSRCREN